MLSSTWNILFNLFSFDSGINQTVDFTANGMKMRYTKPFFISGVEWEKLRYIHNGIRIRLGLEARNLGCYLEALLQRFLIGLNIFWTLRILWDINGWWHYGVIRISSWAGFSDSCYFDLCLSESINRKTCLKNAKLGCYLEELYCSLRWSLNFHQQLNSVGSQAVWQLFCLLAELKYRSSFFSRLSLEKIVKIDESPDSRIPRMSRRHEEFITCNWPFCGSFCILQSQLQKSTKLSCFWDLFMFGIMSPDGLTLQNWRHYCNPP